MPRNSRMPIEPLLASYPRERPPLSPQMKSLYVSVYQASRRGKGVLYAITQRLESWMHRRVAQRSQGGSILEIGAGTLNHLAYEPDGTPYDIIEPFRALYEGDPLLQRVRTAYADIAEIPLPHGYDRIISVATLEHLTNLPQCLAKASMLLNDRGMFQAGIPSEGGFLWEWSWRLSVGLSFRLRTGLDYGELMRHEHVNNMREIIDLVGYFFEEMRVERFPFPGSHFSLYGYIEATRPRLDRCQAFERFTQFD